MVHNPRLWAHRKKSTNSKNWIFFTSGLRWKSEHIDAYATRTVPENCDASGISPERSDVFTDPQQSGPLIPQRQITRTYGIWAASLLIPILDWFSYYVYRNQGIDTLIYSLKGRPLQHYCTNSSGVFSHRSIFFSGSPSLPKERNPVSDENSFWSLNDLSTKVINSMKSENFYNEWNLYSLSPSLL